MVWFPSPSCLTAMATGLPINGAVKWLNLWGNVTVCLCSHRGNVNVECMQGGERN